MNSTLVPATGLVAYASCWQQLDFENKEVLKTVVSILLWLAVSLSVICSTWCATVIFVNAKLRKPTWIFKASMAVKDLVFCVSVAVYALQTMGLDSIEMRDANAVETKDYFNLNQFLFNVIFLTCIASSFVHFLLICFDRHQVISRPFRYHTGELLPPKVACILVVSGWAFCSVIGLSVTSQALETAEQNQALLFTGTLLPLYRLPGLQKLLLGGGMILLYFLTVGLLCIALAININRAKVRKEQLLNGGEDPEPLRSRNNSVCHASGRRTANQTFEQHGDNSEAEANEFLMSGGGGFGLRPNSERRPANCVQEVTIFTPVHYRPSLLRRIRDIWSLYSAAFCVLAFTILLVIPFVVLLLADPPESTFAGKVIEGAKVFEKSRSNCIGVLVMELLLLLQGFIYVLVYLIIDDVFRPFFLLPFTMLHRKIRSQEAEPNKRMVKRMPKHDQLVRNVL